MTYIKYYFFIITFFFLFHPNHISGDKIYKWIDEKGAVHFSNRPPEELKNLKNAVHTTFQRTRGFIFDLRPMMLDDLGLVPTLKRYVEELEAKSEFQTSLTIHGSEGRCESHTEVIIFRAVQALLDNVSRHAQANQAQVTLDIQQEQIVVTVEDDGSGFSENEALRVAEEGKVLGLSNVMEQVKLLGGTFDIDSQIGRGTMIRFSIPVS